MLLPDFLFAFVVTLVVTAVLIWGFNWRRPNSGGGAGAFFLMLLLFLAIWAGGIWLVPFGPMAWNIYWLPFVFVGIFLAILLLALIPPEPRNPTPPAVENVEEADIVREEAAITVFGTFFWIFVIILAVAIAIRYLLTVS